MQWLARLHSGKVSNRRIANVLRGAEYLLLIMYAELVFRQLEDKNASANDPKNPRNAPAGRHRRYVRGASGPGLSESQAKRLMTWLIPTGPTPLLAPSSPKPGFMISTSHKEAREAMLDAYCDLRDSTISTLDRSIPLITSLPTSPPIGATTIEKLRHNSEYGRGSGTIT